jgi:predicted secreted protein
MKILLTAVTALIIAIAVPASGDDQVQFNIIDLRAEQSRQVENDLMVVLMQAAAQKNSSAEAGKTVNEMMVRADRVISADDRITHQTMNYQTRPVYHDRVVTGWTVSQQLRLQSKEFEALTGMVGTLQEELQVISMQFQVSEQKRSAEIDTLIIEALEAFTAKAELITRTMKARDYRLVAISIDENGSPVVYRGMVQAEAMTARAPVPQVETGDSRMVVRISGSIQLIF